MAYIIGGKRNGEDWPYDPERDRHGRLVIAAPVNPETLVIPSRKPLDLDHIQHAETYIPMQWRSHRGEVGWILRHENVSPGLAIQSAILRGYVKA